MVSAAIVFLSSLTLSPAPEQNLGNPLMPKETAAQKAERMKWFVEGRFGLFIHWGPVSLKGTEISWSRAQTNPRSPNRGPIPAEEYDNLYKRFNPVQFNAKDWAAVAKAAGTKYVVLTAKHCDGFLLWPSKTIDYTIANTPFKRDVCGELADAVHKANLRLGWYFSPMDWKDPDCRAATNERFIKRMQGQLRELTTNYGRLDLLWFDWDGMEVPWDQANTYKLVRSAQPKMIVNNRLECFFGGPTADKYTGENADYLTPEQVIGVYNDRQPWETCMTLGTQWSWKPNDQIKTVKDVVGILARCAGGDGNLLLNVGPMPDGRIEPRQVEVLKGVGKWLGSYGESIYATRGGPYKPAPWGASTRKGNTIYLHVLRWPDGPLKLGALPLKVKSWKCLTGAGASLKQTAEGLVLDAPATLRRAENALFKLTLEGPASSIKPIDPGSWSGSLAYHAKCSASNVYKTEMQYGPQSALDDDPGTRWATDSGTKAAWLEVDLGRERSLSRVFVDEAFPELRRVKRFAIEVKRGDEWVPVFAGKEIGRDFKASFASTQARFIRLNILEAADGPTIWEFQVFGPEKQGR